MIPPREATLLRSRPNVGTAASRCDVPELDVVAELFAPSAARQRRRRPRRGRAPGRSKGGENRLRAGP